MQLAHVLALVLALSPVQASALALAVDQQNMVDMLIVGVSQPSIIAVADGSQSAPTASVKPTVSMQRFDASSVGPTTVPSYFHSTRVMWGNSAAHYNLVGYIDSVSAAPGLHDIVGVAGIAGSLEGANAKAYGLFGDARLHNLNGRAVGAEIDVRNYTGVEAPPIGGTLLPVRATIGQAIVGYTAEAGSRYNSVGTLYQSGNLAASAFLTGVLFQQDSVVDTAIDTGYLDPAVVPLRIAQGSMIVSSDGTTDVPLIGTDAAGNVVLGGPPRSGTYTPAQSPLATANVSSVIPRKAAWLREGNTVMVQGSVTVTTQAGGGTVAKFGLALPVPSAIADTYDINGTGAPALSVANLATFTGDAVNDGVTVMFASQQIGTITLRYTYGYEVR